jgi:hypothetical protein
MLKLWQLRNGEQFICNGFTYIVKVQDSGMTEVFGKGRYWAWPCYLNVTMA